MESAQSALSHLFDLRVRMYHIFLVVLRGFLEDFGGLNELQE